MFREKIKVLDCTIRDGGLINNHDFGHKFVRAVYKALSEAGVDYWAKFRVEPEFLSVVLAALVHSVSWSPLMPRP